MDDNEVLPQLYYVLFHSPGEKWDNTLSFQEQPGVEEHVGYMASFLAEGKLAIGGPFLDDSGGMMVFRTNDQAEAEAVANADPAVQKGLLRVTVKPWFVPMSNLK